MITNSSHFSPEKEANLRLIWSFPRKKCELFVIIIQNLLFHLFWRIK